MVRFQGFAVNLIIYCGLLLTFSSTLISSASGSGNELGNNLEKDLEKDLDDIR